MNPSRILERLREEDPKDHELFWFLASFANEPDGLESLIAELDAAGVRCDEGRISSGQIIHFCTGEGYLPLATERQLVQFMRAKSKQAREQFYRTNIGRKVWDTLDWCLEENCPCFIEGREGRGKSASARAWYQSRRGLARYVSLPGFGGQRDFFQALAVAYGVNFSAAKAPNEIRWRVRDAIVRSGLMLIIDEAHLALPERTRKGRPPMIDWIDCELCNNGVPVALISTPQFGPRLAEFESTTLWNAGQFRRRFAGRWCSLPKATAEDDLQKLAEAALPHVGRRGINLLVGYATAGITEDGKKSDAAISTLDRDVSGMFDLVRDARRRAQKAGRTQVTFDDLRRAYELDRLPSENAMADAFTRPVHGRPSRKSSDFSSQDSEPSSPPEDELKTGFNRLETAVQGRRGESAPALVTA